MKKKNTGGRPKKYTDVEIMEQNIEQYFASCFVPLRDRNGNILIDEKRKSIKKASKTFYYLWISRCT